MAARPGADWRPEPETLATECAFRMYIGKSRVGGSGNCVTEEDNGMPYLIEYVQIHHITWQGGSLRLIEVKSRASSAASAKRFSGPILLEFAAIGFAMESGRELWIFFVLFGPLF